MEQAWQKKGDEAVNESSIQFKNLAKQLATKIQKMNDQRKVVQDYRRRPVYITEGYSKFVAGYRIKNRSNSPHKEANQDI